MTPADTMRAAVEALTAMCQNFPTDSDLVEAGWATHEINAACNAYDKGQAALPLLRSALSDDALRRAGAAGPLGDPDVLASPLPNEVLHLLNHIEDVIGDEAWARIDAKLWNAVTKLASGVGEVQK